MAIPTLVQFEDNIRDTYLTDNPGYVTKAEYMEAYPRGCRREEWEREILDAARKHEIIPAIVLDDLYKNSRRTYDSLFHDYREYCWPEGYLNPDVRHQEPMFDRRLGRKVFTTCAKCGKRTGKLTDIGSEAYPYLICGTCQHREERRINTKEMYGHGRRGY